MSLMHILVHVPNWFNLCVRAHVCARARREREREREREGGERERDASPRKDTLQPTCKRILDRNDNYHLQSVSFFLMENVLLCVQ